MSCITIHSIRDNGETVNAHEERTEYTAIVTEKYISIYGAESFDKYTGNGMSEYQCADSS